VSASYSVVVRPPQANQRFGADHGTNGRHRTDRAWQSWAQNLIMNMNDHGFNVSPTTHDVQVDDS